MPSFSFSPRAAGSVVLAMLAALLGSGLPAPVSAEQACANGQRVLDLGFYAYFSPVSHSADPDPAADGFNTHLGYEADLLTALEAMEGTGLVFSRRAIAAWDGIWLKSALPDYDIVGGGITILESRTRDAADKTAVVFTQGHIGFRQSLLVRAEEVGAVASHDALTSDVRVGVLAGTTGEARLLQLTGLIDEDGVLAAGVRVVTPGGEIVADGGADYVIAAAGASPRLEGRRSLHPPSAEMPRVIYLGDEAGEAELLEALAAGEIDAVARGEIGNRGASHASGGAFVVTALDPRVEHGGFTLAAEDEALASCIDRKIEWLTDGRRIGYAAWLEDRAIFMERARMWNEGAGRS